jgi:SSS family solute:Na+ symporter
MVGGFALLFALQAWLQYAPMAEAPAAVPLPAVDTTTQSLVSTLDYVVMFGYLIITVAVGLWSARGEKTAADFFYGGQRFSWWLIAASLIATTVGSYSFVKYSQVAYNHGISSTQSYLNDWMWMPLLAFSWLPIIYFSRVTSIPQYFERRFGRSVRDVVTFLMLIYLVGYVGVNLFTMGKALNLLTGWDVFTSAAIAAVVTGIYVTSGGQASVIMTDLFQGAVLLAAGVALLWLGVDATGGAESFWSHLPREMRQAFSHPTANPSFPAVGIFWQDAVANSAMFYFLNQGILMRFLAARSVQDARKAVLLTPLVLMPLAAIAVASGGWVGRALEHAGLFPSGSNPDEVFFLAASALSKPGFFGLIMAALTAALMSTVDSLITAVASIAVNDVYVPYVRPRATERELLRAARIASVSVSLAGIALVPVFMAFDTIYAAHGAFTAAITPPLVVTALLAAFWRRFTAAGALASLIGGSLLVAASLIWPSLVELVSQGVATGPAGDGLFGGAKQHLFMRACWGLAASAGLGVIVSLFTRPEPAERTDGLVWGTLGPLRDRFQGSKSSEGPLRTAKAAVTAASLAPPPPELVGTMALQPVDISAGLAASIGVSAGDRVFLADPRWWFGGLRSLHARVREVRPETETRVWLGGDTRLALGLPEGDTKRAIHVTRLY